MTDIEATDTGQFTLQCIADETGEVVKITVEYPKGKTMLALHALVEATESETLDNLLRAMAEHDPEVKEFIEAYDSLDEEGGEQ